MKLFLFIGAALSFTMMTSKSWAQVPPDLNDPLIMELQFYGVSQQGLYEAMWLKAEGKSEADIRAAVVKSEQERAQREDNEKRRPDLAEAAIQLCDGKFVSIRQAAEKRSKNEEVDIAKTLVAPYAVDRVNLRICLSATFAYSQTLDEKSLMREAYRTVIRDAYAELEKYEVSRKSGVRGAIGDMSTSIRSAFGGSPLSSSAGASK